MKKLPFLMSLAFLAAARIGHGQSADDVSISSLHRATPAPAKAGTTTNANMTGPFEASLSSDQAGKSSAPSTASFTTSTPKIYVHFAAPTATKGEKLRVVWIAEDAKPYAKGKKITENTGTLPGPGSMGSYYLPSDGLPVGKYAVEVYEGSKLQKNLKFTVKK